MSEDSRDGGPRPASQEPVAVVAGVSAFGIIESRPAPAQLTAPPAPTPGGLRPRPAPGGRRPAAVPAPRITDPTRFGRIDESGTVWLRTPEGDVVVGNWAAGTVAEGLAFFGRKYDDILVEVDLAAYRLREGRGRLEQARAAVEHAQAALVAPQFIGDVMQLRDACAEVERLMADHRAEREAARVRQREEALRRREELVAEAESLQGSTAWKSTGERYAAILEEWKTAAHVDRATEQHLWRRFSAARAQFDRRRRQHFAQMDVQRKEAVAAKEALIAEATTLSSSTDWAGTSRAFRQLMDRWKSAGHAGRAEEERLWARFREAQDAFFRARDAANAERDGEMKANLELKQALATEAEALLPVTDLASAKRAMRSLQDRWDAVGPVPRADRERVEGRLKRVEDALRAADQQRWGSANPEVRARAEETAAKFRAALDRAQADVDSARERGDYVALAKAEQTLESTRALLEAAEGTLSDLA